MLGASMFTHATKFCELGGGGGGLCVRACACMQALVVGLGKGSYPVDVPLGHRVHIDKITNI